MFTDQELAVMFHVLNNAFGPAWEAAAERAQVVEGMPREEFIAFYTSLLRKLANV